MEEKNSRRDFLKKGLSTTAFAMLATSQANAFSMQNPGRDAKDPKYIGQVGKHFVMVMDLRKCIGCQACTATCMIENLVPKGQHRTFVPEMEIGEFPNVRKGFLPQLCNHCDEPSCVSVCPTGATFKRKDGIVVVDNTICWGCGYCVEACPYDKRFINTETKVVDKCNFCAQRVDEGLLPACVETCIGGARIFGDLNDKNSEVSKLLNTFPHDVLKPEQGNKPQVFYIGLDNRLTEILDATPGLDDWVRLQLKILEKEWAILPKKEV